MKRVTASFKDLEKKERIENSQRVMFLTSYYYNYIHTIKDIHIIFFVISGHAEKKSPTNVEVHT